MTDGKNHLDLVEVALPAYVYYDAKANEPVPVVTAGDMVLQKDLHYTLTYGNNTAVTTDAYVTVKGIGDFSGYELTHNFEILKRSIADFSMYTTGEGYHCAEPIYRDATLYKDGQYLKDNQDFVCLDENNVNMGTATVYAAGIGNYYDYNSSQFKIGAVRYSPSLKGAYNGRADGELNEEIYVDEIVISAGSIDASVNSNTYHVANYELYRLEGEQAVLVTTLETDYDMVSNSSYQRFKYDFSHVYEEENEIGGAVYMLAYTWIDRYYSVYSGMLVIGVLSKVPEATTVEMYQVTDDGDFRRDYLELYSEDGDIGPVTWTSSDESVATVEHGQVTFKKPGTVTITGSNASGTLSASKSLTAQQQDLSQANILGYDAESGTVDITYQGFLLTQSVDYVVDIAEEAGKTVITASGKGLFAGQIVREFTETDEPVAHTHSFDNCEDLTCANCTYERTQAHAYDEKWNKNETEHWHSCKLCGQEKDRGEHILSASNDKLCQTCGQLYMVGDVDDDGEITDWDGVLLARYLAGWNVEVPIIAALDIDGDGEVTDWDGVVMDRYLAGWNVTIG